MLQNSYDALNSFDFMDCTWDERTCSHRNLWIFCTVFFAECSAVDGSDGVARSMFVNLVL